MESPWPPGAFGFQSVLTVSLVVPLDTTEKSPASPSCGSWFLHIIKLKDTPPPPNKPSPLQAKLPQLSQPLLIVELPHSLHHLCGSRLYFSNTFTSLPYWGARTEPGPPGLASAVLSQGQGSPPGAAGNSLPNAVQESTADAFAARAHCQNGSWISVNPSASCQDLHKVLWCEGNTQQSREVSTCPSTAPKSEETQAFHETTYHSATSFHSNLSSVSAEENIISTSESQTTCTRKYCSSYYWDWKITWFHFCTELH